MEGQPQGKGRKESLRMTNTNHNAKKKMEFDYTKIKNVYTKIP